MKGLARSVQNRAYHVTSKELVRVVETGYSDWCASGGCFVLLVDWPEQSAMLEHIVSSV